MTEDQNLTIATNVLEPILNCGLEDLPDAVATLINHAMLIEHECHIGSGPYQRTEKALTIAIAEMYLQGV